LLKNRDLELNLRISSRAKILKSHCAALITASYFGFLQTVQANDPPLFSDTGVAAASPESFAIHLGRVDFGLLKKRWFKDAVLDRRLSFVCVPKGKTDVVPEAPRRAGKIT
jgi:hypothetical protein